MSNKEIAKLLGGKITNISSDMRTIDVRKGTEQFQVELAGNGYPKEKHIGKELVEISDAGNLICKGNGFLGFVLDVQPVTLEN
jgi:hypothetical protein